MARREVETLFAGHKIQVDMYLQHKARNKSEKELSRSVKGSEKQFYAIPGPHVPTHIRAKLSLSLTHTCTQKLDTKGTRGLGSRYTITVIQIPLFPPSCGHVDTRSHMVCG